MSLKYKLILFCLAISILPLAVTAVVSMRQAGGILGEQAFAGLEAARDSRKQALEAAAMLAVLIVLLRRFRRG